MPLPLLMVLLIMFAVLADPLFIIFVPFLWYAVGSLQGQLTGEKLPFTDQAGDVCRRIHRDGTSALESNVKTSAQMVKNIAKSKTRRW